MSASYPSSAGWEPYGSSQQAAAVGWRTSATQPSQIPTPSPPSTQPSFSRPPTIPHWKRSATTAHLPSPITEPSRGEQRLLAGQRALNETVESIAEQVSLLSRTVGNNQKTVENFVETSQNDVKLVLERVDGLEKNIAMVEKRAHSDFVKLLMPKIREVTRDVVRRAADKALKEAVKAAGDLCEKKMEEMVKEGENKYDNEDNDHCRKDKARTRRRNRRVVQKDTMQPSRILRSQTVGKQIKRKERTESEYTELFSSQTDDSSDDNNYVTTRERKLSRHMTTGKKRKSAQKKTNLTRSYEQFSSETDSDCNDAIQPVVKEPQLKARKKGRMNVTNGQKNTDKSSKQNVPQNRRVLRSHSISKYSAENNQGYIEGFNTRSSQSTKRHKDTDYNTNEKNGNRVHHEPLDHGNPPEQYLRPKRHVSYPEVIVLEESNSTQLDFEEQANVNGTQRQKSLSVVADDENVSDPFFQDNR